MQFHYSAVDKAGRVREGDTDAATIAEVLQFLAKSDLRPLSIKPVVAGGLGRKGRLGKISLEDKIFLMKYLALMMRVGTDPFKAIDILVQDVEKPALKQFLIESRTNLEKGNPFHLTFESHPEIFSPVAVNLIKAAGTAGTLERTMEDLSNAYTKEAELRGKVRGALIYPALLLTVASLIVTLLVTFVLPRIASIFGESGANIPIYSRIVLGIGLFLNKYIWYILPAALTLFIGGGLFFFKTPRGRLAMIALLDRVPVVRDLVRKMALQRFAATLSSLLKAGVPILESLDITATTVGHDEFRSALLRISSENVARGVAIGDAFRKERAFPRVVTNLMMVGERTGHVEEILGTLASFYENEIDVALKTLVSFVEPALLMGIGLVVATIALSIIVPIYQLVSQY